MKLKNFLSKLYVAIALIATCSLQAQLNNFTIGATTTAQTCLGNGSINFTVSGNNPGAALEFAVFLLPNTTTPFTTVTTMSAQNLVAGDYKIVATQTLNGNSNTAMTTATVGDNTAPLAYTLNITNVSCNANGSITVNVTSGTATQYEIISGPETAPLQPSNVFSGLPAGQYAVRVHDNCGDAFVTTVQLVEAAGTMSVFADANYLEPVSCNTVAVKHYYSSDTEIIWPLSFQYIINPPGVGANVIVNTAPEPGNGNVIVTTIPLYYNQAYTYDIKVTDGCGNVFTFYSFIVPAISMDYDLKFSFDGCTPELLIVDEQEFMTYPVTLNFTAAPAAFNPITYNATYPVFEATENLMFSLDGSPLPLGSYSLTITDACNRVKQKSVVVTNNSIPPKVVVQAPGCVLGSVKIEPAGKATVEIKMISAPAAYEGPLPKDLMGYMGTDGSFLLEDLPPGDYTFYLKDECGYEFTMPFTITISPVQIVLTNMTGCSEGYGSVSLRAYQDEFTQLVITAAPDGFAEALPFDASGLISNGGLYMNGLPAGDYTYTYTTENCAVSGTGSMAVTGYTETANDIDVIANCGSFDLYINNQSNITFSAQYYWLQKYDAETGFWGHPETGEPSTQGNVWQGNAVALNNDVLNLNLPYTGQFRVVKTFYVFGTEDGGTIQTCNLVLGEFTFTGAPSITAAYSFPCDNGLAEVIVVAEGVAPLTYEITSKNGVPFTVDNGAQNVFLALQKAVYNFRVTDACNNLVNVLFDVSVLEPLAIEGGPFCNNQPGQLSLPQFTFLLYEWYREDDPDTILSTGNTLDFAAFNSAVDAGGYRVHLVSVTPGSCIDFVLEYNLTQAAMPQAGLDNAFSLCNSSDINLNDLLVQPCQTGGIWQDVSNTGQLDGSIFSTVGIGEGSYMFEYVVDLCDTTDEAVITVQLVGDESFPVLLEGQCVNERYIISIVNTEVVGESQPVTWSGPEGFSYTGPETSIDVTNLPVGNYGVLVTNANGCRASKTLPVGNTNCSIPRGISPNGDEWNNSFDLSNLDVQHLIIFNRYGLNVYEADNYVDEWHGQSDSGDLPTGTYYYVATLSAGLQKTGWVYVQREIK